MQDERMLSLRAVMEMTSLSRSQIYDMKERGEFPQPVLISERRMAWLNSEVQEFLRHRVALRDGKRWVPRKNVESERVPEAVGDVRDTASAPSRIDYPVLLSPPESLVDDDSFQCPLAQDAPLPDDFQDVTRQSPSADAPAQEDAHLLYTASTPAKPVANSSDAPVAKWPTLETALAEFQELKEEIELGLPISQPRPSEL